MLQRLPGGRVAALGRRLGIEAEPEKTASFFERIFWLDELAERAGSEDWPGEHERLLHPPFKQRSTREP
jgi:hypothetical protein